ncbi:hypothetical protein ECIV_ORF52 [European chub iridovirus]|nr:hypothetical protein ECIV_ORF52 [European chub iridovirus]
MSGTSNKKFVFLVAIAVAICMMSSVSSNVHSGTEDNPCTNSKTVLNTLLNQIKQEYINNLLPYYKALTPKPVDVFDDSYTYSIQSTDYNCYTIYETLNFLLGDVFPRATTDATVRLSLAKIATSSQQASMLMNLCKKELACGPAPFDMIKLYHDTKEYGADNIMGTLDTPFQYFVIV